jgi:hypothetical protein
MQIQFYRCPRCFVVYAFGAPNDSVCTAVRRDDSYDGDDPYLYVCGHPLEAFTVYRPPYEPEPRLGPSRLPKLDLTGWAKAIVERAREAGIEPPDTIP